MPGLVKSVFVPGRDVGGLVGVDQGFTLAIGDLRRAADHHPVFAAVVVHLQRQRRLGLDHDALDLEAAAFLQHGVGAPRSGDCAVQAVCRMVLALSSATM